MKKRYRIRSKFRCTIFMSFVMILMLCTFSTVFGLNESRSFSEPEYTEVCVTAGDTLWDLAKIHGPEGEDLRKIIHSICAVNQVSPDTLKPGQLLLIPAQF